MSDGIFTLARRAKAQLLDAAQALKCGDVTLAQLHLSLALITHRQLLSAIEGPPPASPPLRKLAIVRAPSGEECPVEPWMEKKHNGGGDGNAA